MAERKVFRVEFITIQVETARIVEGEIWNFVRGATLRIGPQDDLATEDPEVSVGLAMDLLLKGHATADTVRDVDGDRDAARGAGPDEDFAF